MKIIKPIPINDGNIIFAGIDIPYPQWNSASTYALGDTVQVDSPTATVTINVYSATVPNSVAWTAHGLADETPVIFTTTGALPAGNAIYPDYGKIVAGRAYYVRNYSTTSNLNANYFQLSDTPRGVVKEIQGTQSGVHTGTASTHRVYESLQAANTNKVPRAASSATWWLDRGSVNQYKRFDNSVTSQTRDSQIYTSVQVNEPVDTLALLNISASSMQVLITDAVSGELYNETHSLISTSDIDDAWSWFFTPIERLTSYFLTDLPVSNDATFTVIMSDDTNENPCLCGKFIIGLSLDAGGTQYGATIGFQDYSVKTQTAWGDYEVLERTWSAKASFSTMIETGAIERFFNLLISVRGTPTLFIGAEGRRETMVYGWAKEPSIVIEYEAYSLLSTELEGLS